MRLFVKFYPDVDTIVVDLSPEDIFRKLKEEIYKQTNLKYGDDLKIIYDGVIVRSDIHQLMDYGVKEDTTFDVIIEKMANGKLKINHERKKGALSVLKDEDLVLIFSFLDAPSLLNVGGVVRKWNWLTKNNHYLWRPNVDYLFSQITGQKVKHTITNAPYKTWFMERTIAIRDWNRVLRFSNDRISRKDVNFVDMQNKKEIKIRKKPKELTEEEEQFLKENDAKTLMRLMRKKKSAKEDLKRYKHLKKQKDELKKGTWQVVPEKWTLFDYNQLMEYSFGMKDDEHFGFYENGSFFFCKQDGVCIFVGSIEAVDDKFRFHLVTANDDVIKGEDNDIVKSFFDLLEKCHQNHRFNEKIRLDVQVGELEQLEADAIYQVFPAFEEYKEDVEPSDPTLNAETKGNKIVFKAPLTLYNHESAIAINEENIIRFYLAGLNHAHKSNKIATLAMANVEQTLLKEDTVFKNEIENWEGTLVAKAMERFVKDVIEGNKELDVPVLISPRSPRAPSTIDSSRKKEFAIAIVQANDEESKERVVKGIKKYLSS